MDPSVRTFQHNARDVAAADTPFDLQQQVGLTPTFGDCVGEQRDTAAYQAAESVQRVRAERDLAQADVRVQLSGEPLEVEEAIQA